MPHFETAPGHEAHIYSRKGIPFAEVSGRMLFLDLTVPQGDVAPPLVVMIHGGGWRGGSRNDQTSEAMAAWLVSHGYATAQIDYRKSSEAIFPAQIFDCKGAVRWLRAHARQYGYDGGRVAALGDSAGGHLSVLLGTSAGVEALEGNVGGNAEQSSRVQAIVDLFGPTDFIQRTRDQPQETDQPTGKVYQLLGGPVHEKLELAKLASGLYHVSHDAPPLLILHGTEDYTVLLNQSERLLDAYRRHGLQATIHLIEGAGHGDKSIYQPETFRWITDFLDVNLRQEASCH